MTGKESSESRSKFVQASLTQRGGGTLKERPKDILTLLGAGNHPARAAGLLDLARSTVHYWVHKFLKLGYIKLQTKGIIHVYRLTPLGSKILTGSDKGRRSVALEDFPVKFEIFEHEKVGIKWEKLGRPKNWVKMGFKAGAIRVVKTSRSIIVHPGRIEGFEPYELLYLSRNVSDRVARYLVEHFGMKLGAGVPTRRPGFQVKDSYAKFIADYMTVQGDVGSIDSSPPSKEGHVDIWGPDYTKDYLLMPAQLKMMAKSLEQVTESMTTFGEGMKEFGVGMKEHMAMIKDIRGLVKSLEKVVEEVRSPSHLSGLGEKSKTPPWEM